MNIDFDAKVEASLLHLGLSLMEFGAMVALDRLSGLGVESARGTMAEIEDRTGLRLHPRPREVRLPRPHPDLREEDVVDALKAQFDDLAENILTDMLLFGQGATRLVFEGE